MNGIFLGPLVDRVYDEGLDLTEALGGTPVLLVRLRQAHDENAHKLKDTDPESIFLNTKVSDYTDPESLVCPIVRTGRNRFPSGVILGRALISDICLASSLISKLHASFEQDPETGQWAVSDQYTTNGTWLNGRKLSPHKKMPLYVHDELQFGDASAVFLDAKGLVAICSMIVPETFNLFS